MKRVRRDIIGTELKSDAVVVYTLNNRIVLGKIVKVHKSSTKISIIPLNTTTGGRRPAPKIKNHIREDYNVYVVSDGELLMGTLKGYGHNTGEWDDEDPWEEEEDE
jgi:hypothetical protein